MPRSLSLDMLNAMYAQETSLVVIALIKITHPSWADDILISSNPTERVSYNPPYYRTMSNGDEYVFVPVTLQAPDDLDEKAPSTRLSIENVSQEYIGRIRQTDLKQGRPKLTLQLITNDDLDFVEVEYPEFDVVGVSFNADVIMAEAQIDAFAEVAYPDYRFDPAGFPALHGLPT